MAESRQNIISHTEKKLFLVMTEIAKIFKENRTKMNIGQFIPF